MKKNDVLLVIDVQNDFCPGGTLAIANSDRIIPIINSLGEKFQNVVMTQDWHPDGHISFASSHPGKHPFETITTTYGEQLLWPKHCVHESWGSDLHHKLRVAHTQLILRKGFRKDVDSYSAFYENDQYTMTGLHGYLMDRGLTKLYLTGLAFDFCVGYSALDAQTLGYDVTVIEDACRAADLGGTIAKTKAAFAEKGIKLINSGEIE